MKIRFKTYFILKTCLLATTVLFLSGCVERGCTDPNASNYNPDAERNDEACVYDAITNEANQDFVETYADIVHAMYEDAYTEALNLQETIDLFLANPTIPGLEACKEKWVLAHIPYSQSEGFRFAYGAIDDPNNNFEVRLNAWDFDASRIDYVKGSPNAGVINDSVTYPTINSTLLLELNNAQGGRQITLGYHVIEFLLWGEDKTGLEDQLPGQRTFSDYVIGDTNVTSAKRRGEFLKVCVDRLVVDLNQLANEWASSSQNNYRSEFLNLSPKKATRYAFTGLVNFSQFELAKNRLENSLSSLVGKEESRFSDNSHRDLYFNVIGLRSVFNGRYGRADSTYVEGFSLNDLIVRLQPAYSSRAKSLSDNIVEKAVLVPAPLDYYQSIEVEGSTGPVNEMIQALRDYGDLLTEISVEMGIGIKADLLN
ncbi:hypothetical protein N9A49_02440 [Salibacteraceae bacterium]|nr:hypothetical protein [Salibacteraceae bacterium]